MKLFQNQRIVDPDCVTVISGLPRSGTSMMMKMLEAGGMEILSDGERTPDADNPNGYYEFERVKKLEGGDHAWLADARGRAVKVISWLLVKLPAGYEYKVIMMRRDLQEVLASQRAMLVRRGEAGNGVSDERMAELYLKHLAQVESWIRSRPNVVALDVDYNQVMANPAGCAESVHRFLGGTLDVRRMLAVADRSLYRQRERVAAPK